MMLASIARELLEIESQSSDGLPPAQEDERWSELAAELIKQLRPPGGERRRCLRIPLPEAEIALEAEGRQIRAHTKTGNISNNGITVWVPRGTSWASDRLRLRGVRYRDQHYPQDIPCRVVWSHDWQDAHHLGLEFAEVTTRGRQQFFPCYYRAYREFLENLQADG